MLNLCIALARLPRVHSVDESRYRSLPYAPDKVFGLLANMIEKDTGLLIVAERDGRRRSPTESARCLPSGGLCFYGSRQRHRHGLYEGRRQSRWSPCCVLALLPPDCALSSSFGLNIETMI
jgi:hypothetical protein